MYIHVLEGENLQYHHTLTPQPNPDDFFMHAHDTYEVYYFVSGKGVYMVESTAYPLQTGCVLLMRPGEVHKLQIEADCPYERIVLQIPENSLLQFSALYHSLLKPFTRRSLGEHNFYSPTEFDSRFVLSCLKRVEIPDENIAKLTLESVLPAILAELYRAHIARRHTPLDQAFEQNARMRDILLYVNEHLFDALSLDALCARFYISKTQLERLFRAATGSTAWDYILVKRLVEARREILSGIPVTQAALQCGFHDYSAFYRAYKKRYGDSPALDRRQTFAK